MAFAAVFSAALPTPRMTATILFIQTTQYVALLSVLISQSHFSALLKAFLRGCPPMKRDNFLLISLPL
jgi:hypothetical protein